MNQDVYASAVASSNVIGSELFELLLVEETDLEFVGGGTAVTCY